MNSLVMEFELEFVKVSIHTGECYNHGERMKYGILFHDI
jgi:hypothetical protein